MSTAIPSMRTSKKTITVYDAIPDGDYPARIVRFVGLGVQEQPEFKGEKKQPAFKCSFAFELIGVDATGRVFENENDKVGKPIEPRPSCQFKDEYLFPGAKRGRVFDLCQVLDPSLKEAPGDLEWYMNQIGTVVSVRVGSYKTKYGQIRNKVVSVSSIPTMFRSQVGPARCDTLAFNPYKDTPEMMVAYSNLYKFQRDILAEALDKDNIPYAGKEPIKSDDQAPRQETKPAVETSKPMSSAEPEVVFDDDVPF
ncbi:hypothetical protein PQC38_gp085 [Aeromonas phage BUCT695]|uniref:hypothetical protein n=1 Tax=Aeromonas phage BUCT695 TaxID=2908630 RepID=UPI00232949BC|nr:hypothetical protein PQC38_gp085 [Aeromonas phage BUCT695]UIW10561.1 hypothetical protein [Aeromonas phage BUCT695]